MGAVLLLPKNQNSERSKFIMSKSRTEKIASYDEQIAKLLEKRNTELEKQKKEEKEATEKRQRKRGELLEKLIPETVNLTIEQFTTLINRTTANPFGRDKLAEILKESEAKSKAQATPKPPTNGKPAPQSTPPQSPPNEKTTQPTNADENRN
jgi:hypothetical protein